MTDTGRVRSWSAVKVVERVAAAPIEFHGQVWLSAKIGVRGRDRGACDRRAARLEHAACAPHALAAASALAVCLTIPGPLLGIAVIRVLNRPMVRRLHFSPRSTIPISPPGSCKRFARCPGHADPVAGARQRAASDARYGRDRRRRLVGPTAANRAAATLAGRRRRVARRPGHRRRRTGRHGARHAAARHTAISVRVFQLLHYGVDDRVAAICLVMALGIATIVAIAAALMTWSARA